MTTENQLGRRAIPHCTNPVTGDSQRAINVEQSVTRDGRVRLLIFNRVTRTEVCRVYLETGDVPESAETLQVTLTLDRDTLSRARVTLGY